MTPGHHGRQDPHRGSIALAREGRQHGRDASRSTPGSRSSAPGPSWSASSSTRPATMQDKAVAVHARRARGLSHPSGPNGVAIVGGHPRGRRSDAAVSAGFHAFRALDRGARQHTCCGRHTFGRSPGTEPSDGADQGGAAAAGRASVDRRGIHDVSAEATTGRYGSGHRRGPRGHPRPRDRRGRSTSSSTGSTSSPRASAGPAPRTSAACGPAPACRSSTSFTAPSS